MNQSTGNQLYLSTCISGLQEPAATFVKGRLSLGKLPLRLDGLLLYEANADLAALRKLPVVSNTFLVLSHLPKVAAGESGLQALFQAALQTPGLAAKIKPYLMGKTQFRLVLSDENKLISTSGPWQQRLTQKLIDLQDLNLEPSSHRPQIEFWLLRRREGCGFFLLRLTRAMRAKSQEAGSLSPQLACLLCHLGTPAAQDRFLDPCAGSGAIPLARLRHFPAQLIFLADNNPQKIETFRQRYRKDKRVRRGIIPKVQDARTLEAFDDQFLDCIVTDPPWGQYAVLEGALPFYQQLLRSFHRVLKPKGRLVLLTACKDEMETAMQEFSDRMKLDRRYDVLVSGKKASVYVLIKAEDRGFG